MPGKNKKYIIVDGEIYTDEAAAAQARELASHRAQQHAQASTTSTRSHGAAQPVAGHGQTDSGPSQPPFMVLPRSNTNLFGLPDVAVFGVRLPAVALIGILVLVYKFGIKGLLFGAMLLYFVKASQGGGATGGPATNTAGTAGQTGSTSGNPVSSLLSTLGLTPPQGPPSRQMQQTGAATTTSHNAEQQPSKEGAFIGRGYKLGGKE